MSRVELNPDLETEITTSDEMIEFLRETAENVAEYVRVIAPVSNPPSESTEEYGHYVDNIEVEAGVIFGVGQARVVATKFTSAWLEFGDIGAHIDPASPPAPLRRGAEAAGLSLTKGD